jgi:HlyD family secretion protein
MEASMISQIRRFGIPLFFLLIFAGAGLWYFSFHRQNEKNGPLEASGTIEAVEVIISPELAGRILEVYHGEGDHVSIGEPLFRIDDELLQSQRKRAEAALETAKANLEVARSAKETAQANVEAAKIQLQTVIQSAHMEEMKSRIRAWSENIPSEFSLPVWYFEKNEKIEAAKKEVESAQNALDIEETNFDTLMNSLGGTKFIEAEKRLSNAQAAFLIAKDLLDRAKSQRDEELKDYAQTIYDSAKGELDAAQSMYDQLLSGRTAEDVKEARARLAVARERYESALDYWYSLLTGEESLQVESARASLKLAEANLVQAENAIVQAQKLVEQYQAELDLIDVQLKKLVVKSPTSGVVLTRNIEPGETIQPGAAAMTIGQLDQLTITVYISEDRYGLISVGQHANVIVDSFPGETFDATVVRIADRAEFTPRNVQTEEGRRTTVFAIKLSIANPEGKLKPGMPADVVFEE